MADEHFWDNGVSAVSTDKDYKLVYETLTGEKVTTPMMAIDEALAKFAELKAGRETVCCEVIKVNGAEEQTVQQFKANVIDVGGTKMII